MVPIQKFSLQIINAGALKFAAIEAGNNLIYYPNQLEDAFHFSTLPPHRKTLLLDRQKQHLLLLYRQTTEYLESSEKVSSVSEEELYIKPLVDYLNIPVWTVNEAFQLTYYNARFKLLYEQISKLSPISGETTYQNLPPEFQLFIKGLYASAFKGEKVNRQIILKIKGSPRSLLFNASPIKNQEGKIIFVIIHARDMTDLLLTDLSQSGLLNLDQPLVDELHEGVFLTDNQLNLISANASFYNWFQTLFGTTITVGDNLIEKLPETSQFKNQGFSKKTLKRLATTSLESILLNGINRTVKLSISPRSHKNGKSLGYSGMLQEITSANHSFQLDETNQLHKEILNQTSEVLVKVNELDRILYASPSIQKIYGYLPSEVLHKNAYAFVHPFDYETFRINISKSEKDREWSGTFTVRILHKNGIAVWTDLIIDRVFDETGKFLYAIFSLRDVSKRVLKEEQFNLNEKLLETISKNVRECLFRSNQQGELYYANDAFRELLGYQFEPIHQIKTSNLFASDIESIRLLNLVLHQGYFQNEEVVLKRKDDSILTAHLSAIKTEDQQGIVFIDGVFRDITAQKEAEIIILEAKEAAEKANKLKAEFLASVSHEIRTPLNGVIGMTSLLKHTDLSEEQKDYVDTIKKSGDHLLSIINDILDFSKIESGYLLTENYPFELSVILEETLDLFAAKAYEKNIELIIDVADNVNEYYVGDATRLRQILVNLIGNGLKFTEKGEIITKVTLAEDQLKGLDDKVKLKFSVSDTGIGIKEEDIAKLFKPFSQVDSSNTRKFGGTGLGLVISEKLIKAMGGTIEVESQYGFGSTFHFTLMLEDHQQTNKKEINYDKLKGLTVLVVDDNLTNLKIIDRILSQKGMHVITSIDPELGLDTLLNSGLKIDLLIVDMQMPNIDGLDFGKQVRSIQGFASIPMILFSSLGDFNALDKQTQSVFNGILTKPAKPSVILSKVMQVLYQETPLMHSITETKQLSEEFGQKYPCNILIAEDNLINHKLIVKILEKMGYQADVVANGIEVLESVSLKRYDLIFMDVQMPEMDGLEATRHLARKRMVHKPNIVAMTANALAGDRENCLAAGMQDYISKPVKIEEIQKMIIQWGLRP